MVKTIFSLLIGCVCLSSFAKDNEDCLAKGSSEIIKVFNMGVALNEEFKRSVRGADENESKKMRKQIEQYDQDAVMPCVRRASQIMEKHGEPLLMHKLMELVISYENSADETLSYSMGKLFAANPAAVERALKEFSPDGRKILSDSIRTGWVNVRPELPPGLGKNRDERLKKLLSSAHGRVGAGR
jgi:hypothetical protein